MDLSEKLKLFKKEPARKADIFDPSTIGFHHISGESGSIVRKEYSVTFEELGFSIDEISREMPAFLSMNGFSSEINLDEILFLDLETTSLSIAAGSIPFLTGIAYFDSDLLVVEQIFIDDVSKEKNCLDYLLPFFRNAKAVATFNGAAFDVPLIKNRYMINRVYGFPMKIPVIDILIPVRRIFRKLYDSLSLGSLEKNLLGFEREGDIPGWLIPDVYFSFQKTGETYRLSPVAEHNKIDIVSMIRVFKIVCALYESASRRDYSLMDDLQMKNFASSIYKKDIELFLDITDFLGLSVLEDENLFYKFSSALKRENDWEKAAEYWLKRKTLFSLNELAKYEEHRIKNYKAALSFCLEASDLIGKSLYSDDGTEIRNPEKWKEIFDKRISRLRCKI